ncbi:MAG: potassium channel family protein [Bacillota bacterium]
MRIIVIGGGKKVYFLVKSFNSKGYEVTVINDDLDYCKKMAKQDNSTIVHGDGTKPYILEDAGIASADMVIALTSSDPDNLVICQIAEQIYKINKTFAVVNDPHNIDIFKQLGVHTVISTAEIISDLIEQKVSVDDILNLVPIQEGKLSVMEIKLSSDSLILDQKISEIKFPEDAIIGSIIRQGNVIIPKGHTNFKVNDKLIILTLSEVQSEVVKMVKGKID